MAYFLLKKTVGQSLEIEISKEEYERIQVACDGIWTLIGIEEYWDSLVQNYIELEMEFLKAAMNSMVLTHRSFHEMHQIRLGFSRRLSNLLTSCKSYLDQTPHQLKEIEDCTFADSFESLKNAARESHFCYRAMSFLRNHAQHRNVPLHGARFESSWIERPGVSKEEQELLRYSVSGNIDIAKLESDPELKSRLREEFKHQAEHLDVAAVTREYIEALGAVHLGVRELTSSLLTKWKGIIQESIARYGSKTDGDVGGLCVTEFDETDTSKPKIEVFIDPIVHLETLMLRNGSMVNLRKRFVTNEIVSVKKSRVKRKAL